MQIETGTGTERTRLAQNQQPVVLGIAGTRNQWCSVSQEPGTSGFGTPGTSGAWYRRNQEPVMLGIYEAGFGG